METLCVGRTFAAGVSLALLLTGCGHKLAQCDGNRGATTALNEPSVETVVWDDGQSTYLRFPGQAEVPAVFAIGPDGKESTVNYSMVDGVMTVHMVARELRVRRGDAVACIYNNAYNPIGYSPGTGTTVPTVERIPKGDGS